MEKQYKPVPDCEALKYKGTPDKPDIKIFVSHRIDLDSETIDNPLYVNVRCGATFDDREGITMLGDDTGDNISYKKNKLSELTVQYWAWKNIQADYYGLCHYRRYLSFASQLYDGDSQGLVHEKTIDSYSIKKHMLDHPELMQEEIVQYDAITFEPYDVRPHFVNNPKKTVYQYWKDHRHFLNYQDMDTMLDILFQKFPDYTIVAKEYMNQYTFLGYNCFILKRDLFLDLCEFEFSILDEMEKRLETSTEDKGRTLAYLSELLFSIWMHKNVFSNKQCKFAIKQLAVFEETEVKRPVLKPAFEYNNIPVVLISSEYYIPYLAVMLKSIILNKSEKNNYDIIILNNGISSKTQKRLLRMVSGIDNFSVRFYNAKRCFEKANFYVSNAVYSDVNYYRIFIPWLFPDYEKMIVMDSDIIMLTDIANLYEENIPEGKYISAAQDIIYKGMLNPSDPQHYEYTKKVLKMRDPYEYVNSGVMLLALDRMRKGLKEDELLTFFTKNNFRIQEQDAINAFFQSMIHFLDIKWNYCTETNDYISACVYYCPCEAKQKYQSIDVYSNNKPYLLHYANQPKPWTDPTTQYADEFWKVARETPYYEELLGRLGDARVWDVRCATHDLQLRNGVFDTRTPARRFADKILPNGTWRREFAKKLLPKGSLRWRFCKQIYYIFKPQYRPQK